MLWYMYLCMSFHVSAGKIEKLADGRRQEVGQGSASLAEDGMEAQNVQQEWEGFMMALADIMVRIKLGCLVSFLNYRGETGKNTLGTGTEHSTK